MWLQHVAPEQFEPNRRKEDMLKAKPLLIGTILIVAALLAACQTAAPGGELPGTGATQVPVETQATTETTVQETATQAPTETEAATETQAATNTAAATAAPTSAATGTGAEVESYDDLVQALEDDGATVTPGERLEQDFFPVEAQVIDVDGEQVQVFEFTNETDQQEAADLIEANGFIIGNAALDWIGQPNFWAQGNLIVLYVGENQDLIDQLTGLLGEPLTGAEGGGIPAAAVLEAQRWLAEELGVEVDTIEILEQEQVDWSDSCLGLGLPNESCLQAITPGWRVELSVSGQTYEVRTDESGTVVRLAPSVSATP
jgi:hypothetical protein